MNIHSLSSSSKVTDNFGFSWESKSQSITQKVQQLAPRIKSKFYESDSESDNGAENTNLKTSDDESSSFRKVQQLAPRIKSKFYGSDSESDNEAENTNPKASDDESSSFCMTTPERKKPASLSTQTPTPLRAIKRKLENEDISIKQSLGKEDAELVSESFERIEGLSSPLRLKQAQSLTSFFKDQILKYQEIGSGEKLNEGFVFHKQMSNALIQSPWLGAPLKKLKLIHENCNQEMDFPKKVFNMDHIVEGQTDSSGKKLVGFHFCPPGHSLRDSLVLRGRNPSTGVLVADWQDEKTNQTKTSTFFPDFLGNEEDLLKLLSRLEPLAKNGDRQLSRDPETGLIVEGFLRTIGGVNVLYSAFPIFHFEKYQEEKSCAFLKMQVSFVELLHQAQDLVRQASKDRKQTSPIRFLIQDSHSSKVVIDIAPLYQEQTQIEKGIYIEFPKKYFEEIEGFQGL